MSDRLVTFNGDPSNATITEFQVEVNDTRVTLVHGAPVKVSETVAERISDLAEEHGVEVEVSTVSSGSKAELKKQAEELGVDVPSKATVADIEQLIADHEASAGAVEEVPTGDGDAAAGQGE